MKMSSAGLNPEGLDLLKAASHETCGRICYEKRLWLIDSASITSLAAC